MSQPTVIGHYRVTSKLGEGGMGDAQFLARFEREAQMLAALEPSQYRDRRWCRAGRAGELVRISIDR